MKSLVLGRDEDARITRRYELTLDENDVKVINKDMHNEFEGADDINFTLEDIADIYEHNTERFGELNETRYDYRSGYGSYTLIGYVWDYLDEWVWDANYDEIDSESDYSEDWTERY